jgi:two-component system sensor histidine kinase KdpD
MSSEKRPNPDELLARVQQQEALTKRGKLRIYFGFCAGVGKTYAMLSAAQKVQSEDCHINIMIGVVETHGRTETAELMKGIEVLPLRKLSYRGHQVEEFDLDTALQRHPPLLLVDELAHSNVKGSRHPKRWQDVEELLATGIDVWTTLNVQHLESLNDVVGSITGIRVMETLPDKVLDDADEVILVDLPVDELLARLGAGRVYFPQQAERATQHFFRKGNLMALRKIALRRTADRVEDDVQNYRIEQSITQVWKTEEAILACISVNSDSEYVVRSTARLAGQLNTRWHAVYVETSKLQRLPQPKREQVLGVLKFAEQLQAHTAILTGEDIASSLIDYARQHNLSKIVVSHEMKDTVGFWSQRLTQRLAKLAPDIDILQLGQPDPQASRLISPQSSTRSNPGSNARWQAHPTDSSHIYPYFWATLACLFTTLVMTPLLPFFAHANITMLFLLTVVIVAVKFGQGPAIFATFLSVIFFNFFFVPPRFTFAISDPQHYLPIFFTMLIVGLIAGQFTAGLRFQARIAAYRERRAQTLFEFAKDLAGALQTEQIVEIGVTAIEQTFGGQIAIILPSREEKLIPPTPIERYHRLDLDIAQWTFDKGELAGFATDTLPSSEFRFFPLRAPVRIRGVLAIRPERQQWLLIPEQQRQLETFANLIAIALERVHFVEVAQEMVVYIESERLRQTFLIKEV